MSSCASVGCGVVGYDVGCSVVGDVVAHVDFIGCGLNKQSFSFYDLKVLRDTIHTVRPCLSVIFFEKKSEIVR